MSKRALVLIDIQNDYFPGGKWTLVGMEAASEKAAAVLAATRERGEAVIHVRHIFPGTEGPFFVEGSEGSEIHASVAPREGEPVVIKNQVNAFRDTELKSMLEARGVEELVLLGAMSHICIDSATRAAADFGYKVTLIHDACATRDAEFDGVAVPAAQVHASFMAALGFGFAELVSAEDFLAAPAAS